MAVSRSRVLAIAAATLLVAGVADAQPAEPTTREKSPGTALALSLGGTGASIGLAALGLSLDNRELMVMGGIGALVAPSAGHWYAGAPWTQGATLRVGGAGAMIASAVVALPCMNNQDAVCWLDSQDSERLFMAGAAVFMAGTVYDIATARRSANRHNEDQRARASRWSWAPVVAPKRAGVMLGAHF